MSRFKMPFSWLGSGSNETDFETWIARQPLPAITFPEVRDVASPPSDETVQSGVFYRVMRDDKPKWALFACPCGCNAVITLSLQLAHRPHWNVRTGKGHRPSVRPSVWRDIGCLSHFWIEDGRIYWCGDSGNSPNESRRREWIA